MTRPGLEPGPLDQRTDYEVPPNTHLYSHCSAHKIPVWRRSHHCRFRVA